MGENEEEALSTTLEKERAKKEIKTNKKRKRFRSIKRIFSVIKGDWRIGEYINNKCSSSNRKQTDFL